MSTVYYYYLETGMLPLTGFTSKTKTIMEMKFKQCFEEMISSFEINI